jgi:hypothetical protein
VLIAYLDEFGHVGPYLGADHPKFSQHPVFGYAGFIAPASAVREIGAQFTWVKSSLFKTEIDRSEAPHQWERKGSEYFSTGSITQRPEQIRAFRGLVDFLRRRGGKLFYYGDEKQRGTLKQTERTPQAITKDALKQAIDRICSYAESENQDVLIIVDSITEKTRVELVGDMYAHIYSRRRGEMKRIVEAPLHIESKLNSGVQFADWICALVARATAFQLVEGSQFGWAAQHFRRSLTQAFTYESKIHLLYGGDEIHHSKLFDEVSQRHGRSNPLGLQNRVSVDFSAIYESARRRRQN